jgi:endoglycosylceramidase
MCVTLLLLLTTQATAFGLPKSPMLEGLQWLRADGSSIVREDGATVILRGTNLPPLDRTLVTENGYALYLNTAKSLGFNVVRLPILWAQLEPSKGASSSAYVNMIVKIADLSEQKDMYIVLDMHQDRMNGFPSWILAKFKGKDQAALGFWSDPNLQVELIEAWKSLASRLKDEKAIFGYDLLNEPYGGSIPWQDFAPILNKFYTKLVSEIRSVDDRHSILFEPVEGTCIVGEHIALRPDGDNIIFSPHMYVRGQAGYLENILLQLHQLSADAWKVPLWIGEFGGTTVDVNDRDSLNSLSSMLDLFDRYGLGWAYWTLADSPRVPHLVDAKGFTSSSLTNIVATVFPTSYTTTETYFSYNSTPRFEFRGYAGHGGEIRVSVPRDQDRLTVRCINCIAVWDDDRLSLTISAIANTTTYFYMDTQDTLVKLRTLAESEFSQASKLSDEFEGQIFHNETSKECVQEIRDLVALMSINLTAEHYEFVLSSLGRIIELRTSALQGEKNYRDTETFIDSVKQDILASQGYLTEWQSSLLSVAYTDLSQGNRSSAMEWAGKARDLPREPPRDVGDPILLNIIWQVSFILLAIVTSLVLFRSLKMLAKSKPSK